MIRLDDNIRYQNVIAYRKVFPYLEMTYSALIEFVKAAGMEIATPFYHIVDRHQRYIKVMLGYRLL